MNAAQIIRRVALIQPPLKPTVVITPGDTKRLRKEISKLCGQDRALSFALFTALYYNWDDVVDVAHSMDGLEKSDGL